MIKIFKCRRSSLALIISTMLFLLGYKYGDEAIKAVAIPLSLLGGGVAAANAYEKKGAKNAD